jgi:glutamyl-tRNA reductase
MAELETPQLCVVGASYRECSTDVRARLAALEKTDDAPSKAIVNGNYADGVVLLETCSRVEWIVSSTKPRWTEEILRSTLMTRVPEARLHGKAGHAGAHYLLRLAMGLDSVAEGEPAVGRQLVLAFERAHKDGSADRALRLGWRSVQQLMGERRKRGIVQHGLGVQTLVLEELRAKKIANDAVIGVLGLGEIGKAVTAALREQGFSNVHAHRRATMDTFLDVATKAAAVITCTGGPAPFVALPARTTSALAIDVGVPEQIASAPGWTKVPLEQLLEQPRRLLDDDTRTWLVDQVATFADKLTKELADPPPATALSVIDEERRIFLREILPPILEKMPQEHAEEVRRACAAFAHSLMEKVRVAGNGGAGGGGG